MNYQAIIASSMNYIMQTLKSSTHLNARQVEKQLQRVASAASSLPTQREQASMLTRLATAIYTDIAEWQRDHMKIGKVYEIITNNIEKEDNDNDR